MTYRHTQFVHTHQLSPKTRHLQIMLDNSHHRVRMVVIHVLDHVCCEGGHGVGIRRLVLRRRHGAGHCEPAHEPNSLQRRHGEIGKVTV